MRSRADHREHPHRECLQEHATAGHRPHEPAANQEFWRFKLGYDELLRRIEAG
ncbi:MAG TPA: hypothetical protein PLI95_06785 [Polyangiaceae bacterium]|nr:hypothetical protein [Polyangiaceae bacterium]